VSPPKPPGSDTDVSSRKLTKSLAIGATAIAIGGGRVRHRQRDRQHRREHRDDSVVHGAAIGATLRRRRRIERSVWTGRGGDRRERSPASPGRASRSRRPAGQKVTVKKASSTTYPQRNKFELRKCRQEGRERPRARDDQRNDDHGPARSSSSRPTAAQRRPRPQAWFPFQRGAQSTSKQVGQIPANYSQGSGTIVSGAAASRSTEAALAAYPGGVVDRGREAEQRRVRGPQHRRQTGRTTSSSARASRSSAPTSRKRHASAICVWHAEPTVWSPQRVGDSPERRVYSYTSQKGTS